MEPIRISGVRDHAHPDHHSSDHDHKHDHCRHHDRNDHAGHDHEKIEQKPGLLFRFEILFHGLFIAVSIGMVVFFREQSFFKTFGITFASIFLEALPFMLLGALIGGAIEEFVSKDSLTRLLPKKQFVSVFIAAAAGFVMPVCECAVVPVVRRLFKKGLPLGAGIAYLLGGPIFNPIVFYSTYTAYGNHFGIALERMLLGFFIAVAVGFLVEIFHTKASALTPDTLDDDHHDHDACGCGCTHTHDDYHDGENKSLFQRIVHMFRHAATDFLDIGRYLVFGAFIAALLQSSISRGELSSMTESSLASIFFMMLLAFVLNLCSEADAFIAASFRTMMPMVSQTAFMVLGPMLDIKLILMYVRVFQKHFIVWLSLATFIIVFLCMAAMYWMGTG